MAKESTQTTQLAMVDNKFIDGLTKQLNLKAESGFTFPVGYSISKELTAAYLIMKETEDKNHKPIIESCSQISLANSLLDMATLGLSAQRKQGYFIAYNGKCSFQRSYFGNMALARRCGMKDVHAECIYQDDDFEYEIIDGIKTITKHKQNFLNVEPDKIIGAYAVVTMENGTKYAEIMNMEQIKNAWKQGFGYKEGQGTHAKFPDQMAKKTVINRALKSIVNSSPEGWMSATDAYSESEEMSEEDFIDAEIHESANMEALEMPSEPSEPSQISLDDIKADNSAPKESESKEKANKGF